MIFGLNLKHKIKEKKIYTFIVDAKRKGDDLDVNSSNKSRKIERKCVDLIVLGIPWKSTEEAVKRYFEQYGEVVLCEVIYFRRQHIKK